MPAVASMIRRRPAPRQPELVEQLVGHIIMRQHPPGERRDYLLARLGRSRVAVLLKHNGFAL
jgi:hypothetical protein